MEPLAFKITNVYADFGEVNGIATLEDDALVLEFQAKDTVFGILKSDVKELRVSMAELSSVRYQKKWFSGRIHLRAMKMAIFSEIPGNDQGKLELRVDKGLRDEAESFVQDLELKLAEYRVTALENSTNK